MTHLEGTLEVVIRRGSGNMCLVQPRGARNPTRLGHKLDSRALFIVLRCMERINDASYMYEISKIHPSFGYLGKGL